MSYQVIARKWRPQTFDEVTGQETITRTLRNAIEHERLHHAYLFSGARGVGKTTTARLLAKALNCHKATGPTATPCAFNDETACVSCREINESRSIDVLEIDAASNTGVDNVREAIIGNVAIAPARDRYKVFIIDEVHMLSASAFNALLKTLEEPPPRVVFIMATTEIHKVPDTILSRCQQFEFRTIATAKIVERLRLIAKAEKVTASEEALREIARAGEGSMRDAQSAFDQVISFSGAKIEAADVETALGVTGSEMLARVMTSISEQRAADALVIVDDLVMRGHDLRNFCRDLLSHVRDLLVAKVAGDVGSSALLEAAATDARELARQAKEFSESDLVRFFHSLTDTEKNLREAAHPRYQLEVGLVKLMEMRRLAPLGELIERINVIEESLRTGQAPSISRTTPPAATGSGGSSGSTPDSRSGSRTTSSALGMKTASDGGVSDNSESERASDKNAQPLDTTFLATENFADASATAEQSFLTPPPVLTLVPPLVEKQSEPKAPVQEVRRHQVEQNPPLDLSASGTGRIESIKAALEKRRRMFLSVALEGARRALVDNDELFVEFTPETKHLRDNLAKAENIKILREVCREVCGRDLGVRIVVREPNAATELETEPLSKQEEERLEKQRLREIAERNPAVQQMLNTFRGEIIDVRRVEE